MRALLSVFDKTGIVEFAKGLTELGYEIISTGGTFELLKSGKIAVTEVSEMTGFPEILDGRVKTLHPMVHAGILAMRANAAHMEKLNELNITPIDIVAVNLYPFKATVEKKGDDFAACVENIDIGGPTMIRAAAKNFQDVAVICDPSDYKKVIEELKTGVIEINTKRYFMQKAFAHTAYYDAMIAEYLKGANFDTGYHETITLTYEKVMDMRYGENPHQTAAFYREPLANKGSLVYAESLNGKELSFNNINDTNGALELLKEFDEVCVVACKHGNPCGVGIGEDIDAAWEKAYSADKMSIFGGIVVTNAPVTAQVAREMAEIFLEVVVAPDYIEDSLEILRAKKNLRVLKLPAIKEKQPKDALDIKKVNGGIIVQSIDSEIYHEADFKIVTKAVPNQAQSADMVMGMKIVKYVKSNGIAVVKDGQTIGIGPGQVNRIWAAQQCFEHAKELIGADSLKGAVLASDAFFPFDDVIEAAHKAGITAVIQPGGAMRDQMSIDKCDEYGMVMAFTGMRHFRH